MEFYSLYFKNYTFVTKYAKKKKKKRESTSHVFRTMLEAKGDLKADFEQGVCFQKPES